LLTNLHTSTATIGVQGGSDFLPGELPARLLALYEFWLRKRGDRPFPSRRDIDPVEIPHLLPYIVLIDVLPEMPRFRYRLSGTEVDRLHGKVMTHRAVSDIDNPEVARQCAVHYESVVRTGRPRCDEFTVLGSDRKFWQYRRLLLPLSVSGEGIDMLLGVIDPAH
jgi:hypothetical protein